MPKKASNHDAWTRMAWEYAEALQKRTGRRVQVSLSTGSRRGVWLLEARLLEMVDGRPVGVAVRLHAEWPTAANGSLDAFIAGRLMELDHLEEHWRADEPFPGTGG